MNIPKMLLDSIKKSKYGVIAISNPINEIDNEVVEFTKEQSLNSWDNQLNLFYSNAAPGYCIYDDSEKYILWCVYYDDHDIHKPSQNPKVEAYNKLRFGLLQMARNEAFNSLRVLFNYYGLNRNNTTKRHCKEFDNFINEIGGIDHSTTRYILFDAQILNKALYMTN